MNTPHLIQLTDVTGAQATIAPELGGWLLRYAKSTAHHGLVDVIHFEQAVVDRYPKEMWAGNPLLFPMVSYNHLPGKEHHYLWQGREHALPQHGFARRVPWSVVAQSESSLTMELADDAGTRATYPFAFRHRVTYSLQNGRLHYEQVIENSGDAPMPFSTGIHPYFQVPLTKTGERNACFVEIPECVRFIPNADFTQFTEKPEKSYKLPLAEDVSGTVFLGKFQRREMLLIDPKSELEIVLNWDDAPQHRFAALWSRTTDAPFYCLEPWTALPNSFRRAQPGEVLMLDPQKTFRGAMWMDMREV